MTPERRKRTPLHYITIALIEIGFIIFLFYSNLLMGEYERSTNWRGKTLVAGMRDICTYKNFGIAIFTAIVGFVVFEGLRRWTRD